MIARPNEPQVGKWPNEDAQSLVFDDSNLFRVDKFSGWDRVEGGGRANYGVQYTAQFNHGGFVNVLFGQSYSLFGQNSFAPADDQYRSQQRPRYGRRSDYVARISFQPNKTYMFTSRFRFDHDNFAVQRTELEASANFDRWNRRSCTATTQHSPCSASSIAVRASSAPARVSLSANWVLLGAARYDLRADKFNQTQIGVGYIDDCLILAAELHYQLQLRHRRPSLNHTIMFQISLRTIGGITVSQGVSGTG